MEKGERLGGDGVMSELIEGMKLTNKLKEQLLHTSNSSICSFLIDEIVSCYDNALAHLSYTDDDSTPTTTTQASDVPENRKRRRSKEEVSVCSEAGEQQHEDGYNWRKYGQKHILGASHPRSYYRCTHRHRRGCLATKHVQRGEDDNPPTFKIVYRGNHSCRAQNVDDHHQLKREEENVTPPSEQNRDSDHQGFQTSDSSFPLGDLDFFLDFDAAAFLDDYLSRDQNS